MNTKTKVILFFILLGTSLLNFAQDSTRADLPKANHRVFANIYTGGYYSFNTKKPNAGFELSTALLGYSFKKGDNIKFTLIYDVTRTTNGFQVYDTSGNTLPVYYFEGSKYTAFLKMAEIKWQFAKHFSLSAGQMLNEQYLTVQDKFWGHRYVLTTMQELFRMGMPADFGMRVEYKNEKQFAISLGANNGDGPFRHQDTLSVLEYTSNLEFYFIKNLLIKTYFALTPSTHDTENNLKTVFSGFLAYKQEKYKIGVEYSYTNHPSFLDINYSGVSSFVSYNLNPKWELFARYDYVDNSPIIQYGNVLVGGLQYQPEENLFLSFNYRHWLPSEVQQIYFNLGAKF